MVSQSQLWRLAKRSSLLRLVARKLLVPYQEIAYIWEIARSGRLSIYASSRRLKSQKVITYPLDLPPLGDFHDLLAWLDQNAIEYYQGSFCIYIPPQERAQKLFGVILDAYPPQVGLKILKDLRAPSQARYPSTKTGHYVPKILDWIGYHPLEYLRTANYLYDRDMGPRVYDLVEIQTPHNRLSSYVMQHVTGTPPGMEACVAFLERLELLYQDQLIPKMVNWKSALDFRPPDCRGNVIRDAATGKILYIDFQGFMIKDARQYIANVGDVLHTDACFGETHQDRQGKHRYPSIYGLPIAKRDRDVRWEMFQQALRRQGATVEGAVVLHIGCNAGLVLYSALTDGAAWAVGWDQPGVAAAACKLLLALGMSRFDIIGQDMGANTDLLSSIPKYVRLGKGAILFYQAPGEPIGFPQGIKDLPFKYMVYEGQHGETVSDVQSHLQEIEAGWGLRVDEIASYIGGDAGKPRVFAVLHRE